MHCAAQHGHRDVVRALVSPRHGGAADPNIKNCREETPLDLASLYGRYGHELNYVDTECPF